MFLQELLEMNSCCSLSQTEEFCGKSKLILLKTKPKLDVVLWLGARARG